MRKKKFFKYFVSCYHSISLYHVLWRKYLPVEMYGNIFHCKVDKDIHSIHVGTW